MVDISDRVIQKNKKLFTKNLESSKGITIYGEQLKIIDGNEYRSWNPYRSKLAAIILKKKISFSLSDNAIVLYLGAATGTTISHLSDLLPNGTIYAVEHSPVSMKKLLSVVQHRKNIIPLLEDANHPDSYFSIVPSVDLLYQDISQRNQADIFIRNMNQYLKPDGIGIIMVKARSIDVSLPPKKAYEIVKQELSNQELIIEQSFSLSPYEKDHASFIIKNNKKI